MDDAEIDALLERRQIRLGEQAAQYAFKTWGYQKALQSMQDAIAVRNGNADTYDKAFAAELERLHAANPDL